jgi:hypothetical protein
MYLDCIEEEGKSVRLRPLRGGGERADASVLLRASKSTNRQRGKRFAGSAVTAKEERLLFCVLYHTMNVERKTLHKCGREGEGIKGTRQLGGRSLHAGNKSFSRTQAQRRTVKKHVPTPHEAHEQRRSYSRKSTNEGAMVFAHAFAYETCNHQASACNHQSVSAHCAHSSITMRSIEHQHAG